MSTLEDKILGEKLHYYCSSSEDEENDSANSDKEGEDDRYQQIVTDSMEPSFSEWDGTSSNTGPKGVIKVKLCSEVFLCINFCTVNYVSFLFFSTHSLRIGNGINNWRQKREWYKKRRKLN